MVPTESQLSARCLCPHHSPEVKETTVKHPGAARIDEYASPQSSLKNKFYSCQRNAWPGAVS